MKTEYITPQKASTARNFAFLVLALPLGLLYFCVVVTCFALGVGTLVIWVGVPILLFTFLLIQSFAVLERSLVRNLLNIPLPMQRYRLDTPTFRGRFLSYLSDPVTWTSFIYMLFVKLPLGIISFTLVVTLPIVSLALTFLPLVYLVNLLIDGILLASNVSSQSILVPGFIEIHGATLDALTFARTFIAVPIGLLLWFGSSFLLNLLAQISGEIARALLAPGELPEFSFPLYQPSQQEAPLQREL